MCYNAVINQFKEICMNKKLFISAVAGMILTMSGVVAETSIYTDGIGRMHFLGKDPGTSPASQANFSNPMQQDLTRNLYEGSSNEVRYVDHPLKNYENTFSDSRYTTSKAWKQRYQNNPEDATLNVSDTSKKIITSTKDVMDVPSSDTYSNTTADENAVKKTKTKKNKNKKK